MRTENALPDLRRSQGPEDQPTGPARCHTDFIRLSAIKRELHAITGRRCPVSPRQMTAMAADDELPLVQVGARQLWGVWRLDLPEVARRLGLLSDQAGHPQGEHDIGAAA